MVIDKDKIIEILNVVIDALTFQRVALLALLATIVISLLAVFENRSALFAMVYKRTEEPTVVAWTLSEESKSQLSQLTAQDRSLVGIVILTDVDLRKNRRVPKYIYVENRADADGITSFASKLLPQALFDYDPKNTEQMVAMLNNEFKCVKTTDTQYPRFFPTLVDKYPVACRIAVPPFFGEFAGYITAILTRAPTPTEYDSLKIELNRLAIETYLRDISKKPATT